jgi:hypothetical protein
MTRATFRRVAALGVLTVLVPLVAACEPLTNAPPGGGAVVNGTYRVGPFNLAPQGQPGDESNTSGQDLPRPAGAFGLKTMDFDLVYADGTSVPHTAAHLHHIVMMNPARQSQYCSNWPERFAGSGSERTPIRMPDPYAYMVGANDRWNAIWHVMNESTQPQQIYIQYKVGYQPGATAQNTRGVTPFFLDVTGCGASVYDVPGTGGSGSVHTNTRTWTAPWDGILVGSGGHLHGGGIDITLRNNANGQECKMLAHYEHSHPNASPGRIDSCIAHNRVTAGDQFSVISRYDNSQPREDVMGIVMAYAWRGTQ